MKKNILMGLVVAAFGAYAMPDYMTFSTKGPDKYADGATVVDGECYALVRVPTGKTFAGFTADGKAVDESTGKIWVTAPIAKGGKCPFVIFQIPDGVSVGGGSWAVYLLDTRIFKDGKFSTVLAGLNADGTAKQVNSYGLVDAIVAQGGATTAEAVTAANKSADPMGCPIPEISAIKVEGDNVRISVKNTSPILQYKLVSRESVDGVNNEVKATPQAGKVDPNEEIEFICPKSGASAFFGAARY